MSLLPLLHGFAATVIAALVMSIWIAIGTLVPVGLADDDEAAIPVALLFGSAVTAFLLALLSLAGHVAIGTAVVFGAGVLVLVARRHRVSRMLRWFLAMCRGAVESRLLRAMLWIVGISAWISAIAPPRSADAMRYHLAHIRLVVIEGRWNPIQDFHYALPFGWTLSFLPFELLGLPQGSQLLSMGLLLVTGASVSGFLRRRGGGDVAVGIVLLLLLHPFVVRTFVEASADPYSILAVLGVSLLLLRLPGLSRGEAWAFGFAAWVGIGSRYQLVAIAIAATAVFLICGRGERRGQTRSAILGAATGALLASPFYLANLAWFENPVWPLLLSPPKAASSFADIVAYYYGRSLTGARDIVSIAQSAWNLLSWPRLFPVALVTVVAVLAAATSRDKRKVLAWLGIVFLVFWAGMQPMLFPRFILILLPVGALLAGMTATRLPQKRPFLLGLISASLIASAVIGVAASRESFAYAATGDKDRFHRHTWFYPVYSWANSSFPPDARVLAIVRSGMTYYLERSSRRGDPWIGGEVDWRHIRSAAELHAWLTSRGYTHVIYNDRDWTSLVGGPEMIAAVRDAENTGHLQLLRTFDVPLYWSRFRGDHLSTRVFVYGVRPATGAARSRSATIASAMMR